MHRDHRLYLDDILEAIARIRAYVQDMNEDAFRDDNKSQDAVIRNLEVIGEAARKLPANIRAAAPEIEWRKIIAFRNILTHEYFGINMPIVWDVTQNKLGALEAACRRLAKEPDAT
ncbi:MAG: DUF86 domain-containing protein [Planctomycetaceae bacterium]|nr:DUF86 domain-containing protein [Planctomycetaceae bacterium]